MLVPKLKIIHNQQANGQLPDFGFIFRILDFRSNTRHHTGLYENGLIEPVETF